MVLLGEEEAHARVLEQATTRVGILRNVHARRLETVGSAALRAGRAVAVLCDLHARSRTDERGGGGDVEGVRPVAARAHDLEHVHARMLDGRGELSHGLGASAYLVDGLGLRALGRECCQKRRVLGGGGLTLHDLMHYGIRLVVGEVFLHHDLLDGFLDHVHLPSLGATAKSPPRRLCVQGRAHGSRYHLGSRTAARALVGTPTRSRHVTCALRRSLLGWLLFGAPSAAHSTSRISSWLAPSQARSSRVRRLPSASSV